MSEFSSILIANRGEIACRIIRTAKRMGLHTVAIYSDADAGALHVEMADKAVHIGPAPVNESYLVAEKIIAAAEQSGAEAIHPGYGFLSENAGFAKVCKAAGLIFVGPSPDAIALMGDKAQAKRRMIAAGVPCVPGYQGEAQDDATLLKEAEAIGMPIMVKAAAGGGGRGMRLVTQEADLPNAIKDARSEALNAFGSDVLILERAIERPRHVEIQVFADQYGHVLHLGERDCSVQRRHQKVLEEAPCPVMTDELRAAMGAAAVKAARDINYVGAGTVEFMLGASGEFYFLEMNTRLQVEHPVTEIVTGLDLVEMQIRVARGEELALTQDDIKLHGHAIEARLYAEDPSQDFLPASGRLDVFEPSMSDGIRVDTGVRSGDDISPYYDPMIAKIIGYGETRETARLSLIQALQDSRIFGIPTNQAFLIDALSHDDFVKGEATTAFITENFSTEELAEKPPTDSDLIVGAITQFKSAQRRALQNSVPLPAALLGWSSAEKLNVPFQYGEQTVWALNKANDTFDLKINDKIQSARCVSFSEHHIEIELDSRKINAYYFENDDAEISLALNGRVLNLTNSNAQYQSQEVAGGAGNIIAPMHGLVTEIFIKSGDEVTSGQRLAILEAMKMQHEILADIDGVVTNIHAAQGEQITANASMFTLETSAS